MAHTSDTYISVDIEASGPIPGEFSMLSLGACAVGLPSNTFYAELKPINDNFMAKALQVSGLSLEDLKTKGEEPACAMARFEGWIKDISGERRPVFVGFNATFDWMFTHWYFIKFLGRDPFGISGLDIKAYYMGMKNVVWGQTTKKNIRSQFAPTTEHSHNALDDSKEQAEIFEKILLQNIKKASGV
jgi:DNA polymerase III epsilon subunit-like protein